jgi:lactoylglutathione lyase
LRFYCEGLGFERAENYDLSDAMLYGLDRALEVSSPVRLRSQMIAKGEVKIELLQFDEPAPVGSPSRARNELGFTHLSLFVDDVDAVAARLTELGGTILPTTRTTLGNEIVFLADPDGARVELMARGSSPR